MAYNLFLSDRVKQTFSECGTHYSQKKMFGGTTFMVNGKMCVGIIKNDLMVRVNPDNVDKLLKKEGCRKMDFTHRPMKGFLMVGPEGYDLDEDLLFWIKEALAFNPLAKSSKKK